jgi:hypothetical protein
LKGGLCVSVLPVVFNLKAVSKGRLLLDGVLEGSSFQIARRLSDWLIIDYLSVDLDNFLR